jgi:HlyD family secretion protein
MKQQYIVLLFISLSASGCSSGSESSPANGIGKPANVSTIKVIQHTFIQTLEVPANILAQKQVTLMAKVPGEVEEVLVAEGDVVISGQLLVRLDKTDFKLGVRQARAQLEAAKAGVQAANAGLETIDAKKQRLAQLHSKQVISESAYEDIEGGQRATAAQVTMAKAQFQLAQVGLEAARKNLEYTEVRAPFDGVVGKRMVDEGTKINAMPPTPLLMIVDLSSVKIEGAVSELDLPLVQVGGQAEVLIDAQGEQPLAVTVERVEPVVDPMSRTATVRAVLSNEGGQLKAGMSARLVFHLGARDSAAVPDDVVLRTEIEKNAGVVFVLVNGKAVRREVRLGVREGDLREIIEGLTEGETVVRSGKKNLNDGQVVTIDGEQEARQ